MPDLEITVACDVQSPLLGNHGAIRLFGPQKGVQAEEFGRFEARLQHLVNLVRRDIGAPLWEEMPGSGAAGGVGYGLRAFCNAAMRPGFELFSEIAHLSARVQAADVIVTGEGRLDASSLTGKAPIALAAQARALGKPVLAVCGAAEPAIVTDLRQYFDSILPISPPDLPVKSAMSSARELLQAIAPSLCQAISRAMP